jgi:K+-sensing histidine kinase KdpD
MSTRDLLSAHKAVSHALPAALIHDLRTPLSQIIGYSELLVEQAQEAGDDGYVPYLQRVSAAGYQLLALIEGSFHAANPVSAADGADAGGDDDAVVPDCPETP